MNLVFELITVVKHNMAHVMYTITIIIIIPKLVLSAWIFTVSINSISPQLASRSCSRLYIDNIDEE